MFSDASTERLETQKCVANLSPFSEKAWMIRFSSGNSLVDNRMASKTVQRDMYGALIWMETSQEDSNSIPIGSSAKC